MLPPRDGGGRTRLRRPTCRGNLATGSYRPSIVVACIEFQHAYNRFSPYGRNEIYPLNVVNLKLKINR